MSLDRIFCALSAAVFLPYGIYCFVQPEWLRDAADLLATSPTATTEVRAMYGGLEAGLGVLALLGALRDDLRRSALLALTCCYAGLALARSGGMLLDGGLSAYTIGAVALEWLGTLWGGWLLSRQTASA